VIELDLATHREFYPGANAIAITPSGTVIVVYRFENSPDGASPDAPPVQDADGNFYGTTYAGGPSNNGTAYKLVVSPSLQPPVALTLSKQSIEVANP